MFREAVKRAFGYFGRPARIFHAFAFTIGAITFEAEVQERARIIHMVRRVVGFRGDTFRPGGYCVSQ